MSDLPDNIPVDHVVDGIYISGWRATMFVDELRAAGITTVLKLFPDPPYFPEDFNVFENALDDGALIPPAILEHGVAFITEQVDAGARVLVMCGAGISRSATFVLAALYERGHDIREAFALLRDHHPEAAPHPALWKSLIAYYDLDITLKEAIRLMHGT